MISAIFRMLSKFQLIDKRDARIERMLLKVRYTNRKTCFHDLTKAVGVFHTEVGASNGKIPNDLEEIWKLNYNEELRLELEKKLKNWKIGSK